MSGSSSDRTFFQWIVDVAVTLLCWIYFIFGFLFCFVFLYLFSFCFAKDRERSFQYLNHCFFKGFLLLLQLLSPTWQWKTAPMPAPPHGSIIVCNHLSYLDPLLLLAMLPHNKTIVKSRFFTTPIFGTILTLSGYLPATTEGKFAGMMVERVEGMGHFFQGGGNLFVFPEGTRSSGPSLERLHKGVFKIARMYQCPIHVLRIEGTDKLFTPGKFFFKSSRRGIIAIEHLKTIEQKPENGKMQVSVLFAKVSQAMQGQESSEEADS